MAVAAGVLFAGEPPFPNELKYPNIIEPVYTFGSYGSQEGEMIDPLGVGFTQDGRMYVIDSGNNRVQVFDSQGQPLAAFGETGTGDAQFTSPEDLYVGPDDLVYVADTGNNRIQVFDLDGKLVRQWGSIGNDEGQLRGPAGLWVDSSRVYVADTANHRIQVFDLQGNHLLGFGSFGSELGQFNKPAAVTADADGNIYVCDELNSRMQKFDRDGNFVDTWGRFGSHSGLMATPTDVAFNDGKLYLADLINHRIQVFDTAGNFLFQWGRHPVVAHEGEGRLHYPKAINPNPFANNVVVCEPFENRCQVFAAKEIRQIAEVKNVDDSAWWDKATRFHYGTAATISETATATSTQAYLAVGEPDTHAVLIFDISEIEPELVRRFGGYGEVPGKFKNPEGVAFDLERKRLYVSDLGNNRIQVFSMEPGKEGEFITTLGGPGEAEGQFDKPGKLEVDSKGNLYALDVGNARVQVFNSDMEFVRTFGEFGRQVGQFNLATDISLDPKEETLYVLDAYNYRVQAFTKEGKFLRTWGKPGSGNDEFVWPYGMEVGPDNYVYVSDSGGQRVQKFDTQGNFVASFGEFGSELGQFYKPKGLAMSSRNILYVIDFGNHRGQMMTSEGKFVSEWGIGELQQQSPREAGKALPVKVAGGLGLILFACGLATMVWLKRRKTS
ncbi:MAG TPA: NHL repeat-containing protein [Acidobacteriota bacterium]|nr:NHL repeat-containing protein [Acidobacteriota bacterium]